MKIETDNEILDFIKELKRVAKLRGEAQCWENCDNEINFLMGGLVVLKFINRMDMMPSEMSLGYMCAPDHTYSAVGLEEQYKNFQERKNKKNKKRKTK